MKAIKESIQIMLTNLIENNNVYFQPPASVRMHYPAIVYSREDIQNTFADNKVYLQTHLYRVTVIDEEPESEIVKKVSQLPTARFEQHFTKDNLNHDVFTLFY